MRPPSLQLYNCSPLIPSLSNSLKRWSLKQETSRFSDKASLLIVISDIKAFHSSIQPYFVGYELTMNPFNFLFKQYNFSWRPITSKHFPYVFKPLNDSLRSACLSFWLVFLTFIPYLLAWLEHHFSISTWFFFQALTFLVLTPRSRATFFCRFTTIQLFQSVIFFI